MATAKPAATTRSATVRYVFGNVSWDDYQAMVRIAGNSHTRVTYNQGTLEIMANTYEHNASSYLLGRLVDTLAEELEVPAEGGDTTTFQRKDLARGTEANKSYFFHANATRVRGKIQLDLNVDPPPDLVIDVRTSGAALDTLPVYAALGIPEVWRCDGKAIEFLHRQDDGHYLAQDASRNFPSLKPADIAAFLAQAESVDKTQLIREFRSFVRENLAQRRSGQ